MAIFEWLQSSALAAAVQESVLLTAILSAVHLTHSAATTNAI